MHHEGLLFDYLSERLALRRAGGVPVALLPRDLLVEGLEQLFRLGHGVDVVETGEGDLLPDLLVLHRGLFIRVVHDEEVVGEVRVGRDVDVPLVLLGHQVGESLGIVIQNVDLPHLFHPEAKLHLDQLLHLVGQLCTCFAQQVEQSASLDLVDGHVLVVNEGNHERVHLTHDHE